MWKVARNFGCHYFCWCRSKPAMSERSTSARLPRIASSIVGTHFRSENVWPNSPWHRTRSACDLWANRPYEWPVGFSGRAASRQRLASTGTNGWSTKGDAVHRPDDAAKGSVRRKSGKLPALTGETIAALAMTFVYPTGNTWKVLRRTTTITIVHDVHFNQATRPPWTDDWFSVHFNQWKGPRILQSGNWNELFTKNCNEFLKLTIIVHFKIP